MYFKISILKFVITCISFYLQCTCALPIYTTVHMYIVYKSFASQNREIEICVEWKDAEGRFLCGVLYLRLQDLLALPSTTLCLPMEPQGILLAEVIYTDPKTERRRPNLRRNGKLFKGTCACMYRYGLDYLLPNIYILY